MMSLTKIKLLYILRLDPRNQSNHLIHSYVHYITSGSGMARIRGQQCGLLDQEEGKVEAASLLPLLRTAAC